MRARDKGVALVEFAVIVPLLVLIAFGTVEAGFGFLDKNVLDRSTSQAARIASGEADNAFADYELLRSLDSTLSGLRASSITKVIVWEANAVTSPPAGCTSLARPNDTTAVGIAGLCNVYSRAQVQTDDPSAFGGACGSSWDAFWCATTRIRTGDNPDKLGLFVELSFDRISNFLPGSISLTDTAIFQIEPCVAGDPTC